MAEAIFESEIKSLLEGILKKNNLKDISLKTLGNSEQGDGYMGDILFVEASGTTPGGSVKAYDFVLKCSKRNQASNQDARFKESFVNEIFIYDVLLPLFEQFQKEKGADEFFSSVPKCYGTLNNEDFQVIVLENLKKTGYEMWPRKEPFTTKHIDLIIKEYAKLHATSAAMKLLQPETFNEIVDTLKSHLKSFFEPSNNPSAMYESCIEDIGDVLKDDLDNDTLLKWKNFGKKVRTTIDKFIYFKGFEVVLHADSWNNNFMFKYKTSDMTDPSEVSILDWQMSRYCSPICDLSYLLFTCISKEDIENLDSVINGYYKYFSDYLKKLGISDPDVIYSFAQFRKDWDKFCIFGVIMATLIVKLCAIDHNDIVKAKETDENETAFGASFTQNFQDREAFKNRMKHVIEYAARHDLL